MTKRALETEVGCDRDPSVGCKTDVRYRRSSALIGGFLFAFAAAPAGGARAAGEEPARGLASIRVPEGFAVELAAPAGVVDYPMLAVFDDRGRLFVTESIGKDKNGKEMAAERECIVRLIEDRDGDGFFEANEIFAGELSLPMGALWHRGSLYVAAPPDFVRLDDKDGDGVSESREVILTGWNVLNTASLHGPFLARRSRGSPRASGAAGPTGRGSSASAAAGSIIPSNLFSPAPER